MKEQEDIKQDFDQWLLGQWEEASFVPSFQDRKKLTNKLRFRKQKKNGIIGVFVCLSFMLIFMGISRHSSNVEKKKRKRRENVSMPTRMFDLPRKEKTSKETISKLPLNVYLDDLLLDLPSEPNISTDIKELPTEEDKNGTLETFPITLENHLDLDTVMKCLGIFYLQSSISKDRTEFTGVTSGHELVVARSMNGDYSLPSSPDTTSTEGGFRPIGMSSTEYVQFAFYDVKPLLFNEAIYRQIVAINALPKVAYFMKSNRPGWNNLINTGMNINVDKPLSPAAQNQFQNMSRIEKQNGLKNQIPLIKPGRELYMRKGMRVNYKAKMGLMINDNFAVYARQNKVLIVSCDAERVSLVTDQGFIEASHSIDVQTPRFFSQKARYTMYDNQSEKLYLIIETNFAFMWYEVIQDTGETRFIFKTETIWNEPNWAMKDGVLSFTYKGKSYQKRLD